MKSQDDGDVGVDGDGNADGDGDGDGDVGGSSDDERWVGVHLKCGL